MTDTYNTSGVPVDYQDRMAKRMTEAPKDFRFIGFSPELAYGFGIEVGRKETIDCVLEVIDDVKSDANKGYMFDMVDEIKNRVLAFKGGDRVNEYIESDK